MQKAVLFLELKAFDASTSRTASQVWSSYIVYIACMMDSKPTSCPAQTCSNPTDVIMSIHMCVTTALPAIRCSTSPIPVGRSAGFLSNGISRQSRKASKDVDWFSTLQIFLMTSANAFHRSIELFPNLFNVEICFQPYASMPEGPESPSVFIAAFCIFSTSIPSNLTG